MGRDDGGDGGSDDGTEGDVITVVDDGVADGTTDVLDCTWNCGRVTLSDRLGTVSLIRTAGVGLLRLSVVVSTRTGAEVVVS